MHISGIIELLSLIVIRPLRGRKFERGVAYKHAIPSEWLYVIMSWI